MLWFPVPVSLKQETTLSEQKPACYIPSVVREKQHKQEVSSCFWSALSACGYQTESINDLVSNFIY